MIPISKIPRRNTNSLKKKPSARQTSIKLTTNESLQLKKDQIELKSLFEQAKNKTNQLIPHNETEDMSFSPKNPTTEIKTFSELNDIIFLKYGFNQKSFRQTSSKKAPKPERVSDWSLESFDNNASFFYKIVQAANDSEDCWQFINKTISLYYYTKFHLFLSVLILIFHAFACYIGIKNLDTCPKEPKLPIYLFLSGCAGMLKCFHVLLSHLRKRSDVRVIEWSDDELNRFREKTLYQGKKFADFLLNIFILVWFLFGNYWTISIYKPNFEPRLNEPNNWCNKTLFSFILSNLFFYYVFILIQLICVLFLILISRCSCFKKGSE